MSNGTVAIPLQALVAPTISVNGGTPLTLVNPSSTGINPYTLDRAAAGASIAPSDAVTHFGTVGVGEHLRRHRRAR